MTYRSEPLSRRAIRAYAKKIREQFLPSGTIWFPVEKFLECLPVLIGDEEFYFECIEDSELPPNIHAVYRLNDNCMQIRNSVYIGACEGNGRDRMTLAHEIGHLLLLKHSELNLYRNFDENTPCYCDPEWQAKCFAGELLIPADQVDGMSVDQVAKKCGVSKQAARYQLSTLVQNKRRPSKNA
ncbi:ImmA/IrrE family metallo-endopeptidase [uncultured Flavonifractor sp.]|uniref:ImmA/IrrE family metallo-endopeptidase n=1 Tax=uncultured Flavonifractor sp. TaxID=1193534 RepID=UPI00261BA717|nr:ImmA/IrrE family metallo-endopeptidase [uncultured Flavonifractor sp.]